MSPGTDGLGPKSRRLLELLEELIDLLRELDVEPWADWMERAAVRLRRREGEALDQILGAYGGMGSFNDVLPERLDRTPDPRELRARELRSEIHRLTSELRREATSEE